MKRFYSLSFIFSLLSSYSLLASLNDGLVAYYPFNGNANDASGNGNNGIVNGASLTTDRFGNPNSAYSFDGVGNFIRVPNSNSLELTNAFTLSAWINCQSFAGASQEILTKHMAGPNFDGTWIFELYQTGTIEFEATPSFYYYTYSSTSPSLDNWHHVVFTYSNTNSEWTIYIDGVLNDNGIQTYNIEITTNDLFIGVEPHPTLGFEDYFNGAIDDIHIYNRAISSSEVLELYNLQNASAPAIINQPTNQFAQVGTNVFFNAIVSGSEQLNYQWQFNGQNISNATNATLTLNSVTAANSGSYFVVVSNPYGSVTSAAAFLAVLDDGANGNTPVQGSPSQGAPTPLPGVDSLVLVTHGFAWDGALADESWVTQMASTIQQSVPTNWIVVPYVWDGQAWGTPGLALINATIQGTVYGNAVGQLNYKHVHLIGHSAGAAFIEATAKAIKAVSPSTEIHETFLDPYTSLLLVGGNVYGANADWADCYSAQDWTGVWTDGQLQNAYNADVSWLDPNRIIVAYGLSGQEMAISSHEWPVGFYMKTVTNTDDQWCGADYGFSLSEESTGWDNRFNYPIGNTPQVICSSSIAVQNPNPEVAGLTAVAFDVGLYALSEGANLTSDAGFVLNNIISALSLVKSNGVRPLDGTSSNTPTWLAVGVSVTSAINYVQFEAAFTDTNSAEGLLTVYWDTNQIGMVDERVAETNLQMYYFELPDTVTSGNYTLSFRLDSFDNLSSIAVTNVATGFVGATQPITLCLSLTNGSPMLQLTAATNFTYLIQSSTNLVDWTPMALLLNTNGTVQFTDSAATNSTSRFYRATLPF